MEIKDFYEGQGYKLSAKVRDISRTDHLTLDSVSGSTYTFTTTNPTLVTLAADDFILATELEEGETGHLRKVTSVSVAGATVTVEIDAATLEQIVESCEVDIRACGRTRMQRQLCGHGQRRAVRRRRRHRRRGHFREHGRQWNYRA